MLGALLPRIWLFLALGYAPVFAIAAIDLPSEKSIQEKMDALIDRAPLFNDSDIKYAEKQVQKGVKHHAKGRFEKAIQYYYRAIDRVPLFGGAYYELALSQYSLKRYTAAYTNIVRALVMNPGSEIAHIVKASILDDAGYPEQAISLLNRLVSIHPEGFLARLNLGISQLKQARFSEAEQSFLAAREIEPENPSIYYFLFICVSQQGFNYDEERWINRFLKLAPATDLRRELLKRRLEALQSKTVYLDPESLFPELDLIEAVARRQWALTKHREAYPDERGYKPSLAEEMEIAQLLLSFAEENQFNYTLHESLLLIKKMHSLGFLKAYFYFTLREQLGQQDLTWAQQNQALIEQYLAWDQTQELAQP